jgi:hypothetical protein
MRKLDGDACDDGDPETGTSACQNQLCVGVTTKVVVQPDRFVPPAESASKVKIPVQIQIPNESGPKSANVVLQGVANCLDLPVSTRPKRCGQIRGRTADFPPQLTSGLVPITPLVKRNFGRVQPRAVTINLSLTPLAQRLFAKLKAAEQSRTLQLQVAAKLRDRRGRTIEQVFPVLLVRQR